MLKLQKNVIFLGETAGETREYFSEKLVPRCSHKKFFYFALNAVFYTALSNVSCSRRELRMRNLIF